MHFVDSMFKMDLCEPYGLDFHDAYYMTQIQKKIEETFQLFMWKCAFMQAMDLFRCFYWSGFVWWLLTESGSIYLRHLLFSMYQSIVICVLHVLQRRWNLHHQYTPAKTSWIWNSWNGGNFSEFNFAKVFQFVIFFRIGRTYWLIIDYLTSDVWSNSECRIVMKSFESFKEWGHVSGNILRFS